MPLFFINARNSTFSTRDDGNEYDTPEAALTTAVQGALAMASDEINAGNRSTAIVVNVEQEDGTCLLSSVVSISVSPLMVKKSGRCDLPNCEEAAHSKTA